MKSIKTNQILIKISKPFKKDQTYFLFTQKHLKIVKIDQNDEFLTFFDRFFPFAMDFDIFVIIFDHLIDILITNKQNILQKSKTV